MALAASLGRLLQNSSARLRHAAPALAVGIQRTAISTACACRQAAVPEPISEEPLPELAGAGPPTVDWRKNSGVVRNDWTREEISAIHDAPLLDLVFHAASVHRQHNDPRMVQRCTLLSIKTGGCPETCTYCSQSSSWSKTTGMKAEKLMDLEEVYQAALRAKASGSTRFCMGAAWRGPSQVGQRQWGRVLDMVKRIRGLDMEVCTTLGMLTPEQALELRAAGLSAYNHNLDTSPEFYSKITSSRKYEDRLATLSAVRAAGVSVCAGGIIGLGEGEKDRVGLIHQLATLPEHPESVPINALVAVAGTPLEGRETVSGLELARVIATARITMPRSVVRLSAGRLNFSFADQALCFLAGANSIFDGDKLLTTPNNERSEDLAMFEALGLTSRPAFHPAGYPAGAPSTDGSEFGQMPAAAAARAVSEKHPAAAAMA